MSFAGLIKPRRTGEPGNSLEPVRAAVTPATHYSRPDINWVRDDTPAQKRIRLYDRTGPGIVGAMLDIPSGLAAHVELVMQRRTPAGWVRDDDPAAAAILNMWRSRDADPVEMLQRAVRTLDGPGELAQVLQQDPVTSEWFYTLHSTTNVSHARRPGHVAIRTRPDAKPGTRWHAEHPAALVQHWYLEDPEWSGLPWSKLHRALPHIEQYRKAMRTIGRNMDSQLAMNGILWAKATAQGATWPKAVTAWAQKAVDADDGVESVSPFLLSTVEKPEWVDVGRKDHADQMAVADYAIKEVARTSDLPTLMVTEGPGSANHWNEIAINDWVADFTMYHRLARVAGMVTKGHWRPWAKVLPLFTDNPDEWRVWFDDSGIRGKTDNSDDILRLREMGIATREAAAEAKGLHPDQIMQLPDAVDEYEAWVISRNPGAYDAPITGLEPLVDGRGPAEFPDGPPVIAEHRQKQLPVGRPADWDQLIPTGT